MDDRGRNWKGITIYKAFEVNLRQIFVLMNKHEVLNIWESLKQTLKIFMGWLFLSK